MQHRKLSRGAEKQRRNIHLLIHSISVAPTQVLACICCSGRAHVITGSNFCISYGPVEARSALLAAQTVGVLCTATAVSPANTKRTHTHTSCRHEARGGKYSALCMNYSYAKYLHAYPRRAFVNLRSLERSSSKHQQQPHQQQQRQQHGRTPGNDACPAAGFLAALGETTGASA